MSDDRIQSLLDRQAIRDTLFRHAVYCDERDVSHMDEIWAADSGRDNGDGHAVIVGLDAMVEKLKVTLDKFKWTHHHLGESQIEITGDEAHAMTYVACWHETVGGDRFWGTARYYDTLRRTTDGRWLITYRRMIMTGAEGGMGNLDGLWLDRGQPLAAR